MSLCFQRDFFYMIIHNSVLSRITSILAVILNITLQGHIISCCNYDFAIWMLFSRTPKVILGDDKRRKYIQQYMWTHTSKMLANTRRYRQFVIIKHIYSSNITRNKPDGVIVLSNRLATSSHQFCGFDFVVKSVLFKKKYSKNCSFVSPALRYFYLENENKKKRNIIHNCLIYRGGIQFCD